MSRWPLPPTGAPRAGDADFVRRAITYQRQLDRWYVTLVCPLALVFVIGVFAMVTGSYITLGLPVVLLIAAGIVRLHSQGRL